ncbi:hypothetical protein [Halobacillus seohaensis]
MQFNRDDQDEELTALTVNTYFLEIFQCGVSRNMQRTMAFGNDLLSLQP